MADSDIRFPRVTIQFCTQCKWNLRAAYFAQELLQTFSTSLGEISLQPSTGGVFKVDIYTSSSTDPSQQTPAAPSDPVSSQQEGVTPAPAPAPAPAPKITRTPLWDRKTDGGFPETKELKRRVRDVIEPGRNLGHVDMDYGAKAAAANSQQTTTAATTAEATAGTEETARATTAGENTPIKTVDGSGQGGTQDTGEPHQASTPVLPRPGEIAAKVHTLTHPAGAPEPKQRDWGSEDGDRRVPAGIGGTKPGAAAPPPPPPLPRGTADEKERQKKCEDCE